MIDTHSDFQHLGSDSLEVGIVYVNEVELKKSAQINERTLSELLSGLLSVFPAHYPHISRQAQSKQLPYLIYLLLYFLEISAIHCVSASGQSSFGFPYWSHSVSLVVYKGLGYPKILITELFRRMKHRAESGAILVWGHPNLCLQSQNPGLVIF